jgi:hypothetical protein
MRLRFAILLVTLAYSTLSEAQWSTSADSDSSLYVCPGFFPGLVTCKDGSSIVIGALDSYIFAQKLDSMGMQLWTNPIEVLHNDSSSITFLQAPWSTTWGDWVGDGDGGVVLVWYDHREGYQNPSDGHWSNNALYAQHIDRNGAVRLARDGVKLVGPESGLKYARLVSAGDGGVVLVWTEEGFDYPGAPGRIALKAARFDSAAQLIWLTAIDSSVSGSSALYEIARGGQRIYISYYLNGNHSRIIDLSGNIMTPQAGKSFYTLESQADSLVFASYYPGETNAIKYNVKGDTSWSITLALTDSCDQLGGYFVPDDYGGAYYFNTCLDSVIHIAESGQTEKQYFSGIDFGGRAFADGAHGMVIASPTTAKRFNQSGQMVWPHPVLYLQDPGNAEFSISRPDYHGGIIEAFWTTAGGIHAQHTGRDGERGIVSAVAEASPMPKAIVLSQNYPNPFNPSTTISYALPAESHVKLKVFNVLGQEVATLVNGINNPGINSVKFDGSNLSSGIYFYKLQAGSYTSVKKLVLLK